MHTCLLGTEEEQDLCPRCGGWGWYVNPDNVSIHHPDYYLQCSCSPERRRGDWQTKSANRIAELNEISQKVVKDQNFNNFDPDWPRKIPARTSLHNALQLARDFAKDPQQWSLALVGTFGCGKTHLGRAMQNWRNNPDNHTAGAAFVVVPDLLDAIRATFGKNSSMSYDMLFDRVRNAPFLILDDLGIESGTNWVDEKLFQIVNHRYNNRYPTVVLTNKPLGDIEQRIESRLAEGTVFTVLAGDYRKKR